MAVVSPHLDDAVLSLGASIRAVTRRGVAVDVITVLSGDPASTTPADPSNAKAGFATTGEAARARRAEDQRACELIGAQPRWLPFADDANEDPPAPERIRSELGACLAGYGAVLLPGFPLDHADHRLVSRLTLEALPAGRCAGLYVEQPYASWRAVSRSGRSAGADRRRQALEELGLVITPAPAWRRTPARPADWLAKARASGAYRSQLAVLRKAPRARILGYELAHRGEAVLWLTLA